MSNEYIVLNTKKHDTTFWNTIESTYTPSAGEVCIIVPSSITNDNDKIEVVEYQNKNLFDKNTAVAIKIGDGKTVFRDLPELSDISNIHPDWDETDTTSPNYIWHKPITNSDLISIGEKTALIIEDREAIKALEFEEDFNGESYCKLKSLEGGPNHPYDLLTEEDNTWGYYDISYGNAINHETKYFYKNNILLKRNLVTKTDEVKSILIQKINERINWENNYQQLFDIKEYGAEPTKQQSSNTIIKVSNDYYTWDVARNKYIKIEKLTDHPLVIKQITLLADDLAKYYSVHAGQMEFSVLYKAICQHITRENNLQLKNIFAKDLYKVFGSPDNINQIQNAVNAGESYYEINNEIILKPNEGLYMKKNRLQALYNEAHNKVVNQLIEADKDNPVKEVALPLLNSSESFVADDINRIIITKQQNNSDIDKVEINKDNDEFYVIIEDKSSSDVKKFIDSNIITIDEPIQEQVLDITEEIKKSLNSISLSDDIKTLLKEINFDDINIDYHYQKELYNHKGFNKEVITGSNNTLTIDTNNNLIIRETMAITNENSLKIETSLITSISINDKIKDKDIEKIHIDIYDNENKIKKTLKYNKDYFYYNKQIVFNEPIPSNDSFKCYISKHTKKSWSDSVKSYNQGILTFNTNLDNIDQITFIIGQQSVYDLLLLTEKPESQATTAYYGIVTKEDNKFKITFNITPKSNAICYHKKLYNFNYEINNGYIQFESPITTNVNITYVFNPTINNYLKIQFYYRPKSFNSEYFQGFQANWDDNNNISIHHIQNRPLYKDASGRVVLEGKNKDEPKVYDNATDYQAFFNELIKEVTKDVMKIIIEWFNGLKNNGSHLNDIDKILYDIDDNKGLEIEDAVAQIISKIKDLSNEEHPTEVVIQPDKPTNNPNARLWVKTPNNNNFDEVGNGLLYYRDNNSNWKEVSAIWTPTPNK